MIDLHSHILPGLDDGAATMEESLEIARAAVADGIEAIAGTPHVREDYPTAPEAMERALELVRTAVAEAAIPLRVLPGGELALEQLDVLDDETLGRFALGGNASYLLLEFPYTGWRLSLPDDVFRLRARGITPVLAHPERNAVVQGEPERLEPLVRSGALVQVTAASLDGRLGRAAQRTGLQLIDLELAHLIASDAHAAHLRSVGMGAAAEAVGGEFARWLARDVPQAIVDGGRIPRRPEAERPRGGRLRRMLRR